MLLIIINLERFLDISCHVSVFPVDNVRASAGKITVWSPQYIEFYLLLYIENEEEEKTLFLLSGCQVHYIFN